MGVVGDWARLGDGFGNEETRLEIPEIEFEMGELGGGNNSVDCLGIDRVCCKGMETGGGTFWERDNRPKNTGNRFWGGDGEGGVGVGVLRGMMTVSKCFVSPEDVVTDWERAGEGFGTEEIDPKMREIDFGAGMGWESCVAMTTTLTGF